MKSKTVIKKRNTKDLNKNTNTINRANTDNVIFKDNQTLSNINNSISIQGYEGSFHHEAAVKFFGKKIDIKSCKNFKNVVEDVKNGVAHYGVMAIENSTVGSIIANYTLLQDKNIEIVGEVYLPIRHNLIVMPGVKLSDIKEVRSHPMALLQCKDFLVKNNLKSVEWEDTSKAVIDIKEGKLTNVAAIGSSIAAKIFNLEILNKDIHDAKKNWTRFLILKNNLSDKNNREKAEDSTKDKNFTNKNNIDNNNFYNKASVTFTIKDEAGSLYKVLGIIKKYNINMSKIQSFALPNTKFEYGFYADLEFDNIKKFYACIKALEKIVNKIRVHGIYKNGK